MNRWYAWVENQVYGPYTPEQLSEFVKPEVLLCREGTEQWKPAGETPELAFLLEGFKVDPPASVGWMIRKAGSGAVTGPFTKSVVTEMISNGEVKPADYVKHTEWDDWEMLARTKLVVDRSQAAVLAPPSDAAPPNPEDFLRVVRQSSDDELMKEYKQNYQLYARRERKLLKEELLRRGLIKKTFGLF